MKRQSGFSLLEMMVALVIFALLSAAGVGVLAQAADGRAIVHARMARLGELQRARALLAADLAQAAPRATREVGGMRHLPAFSPRGDRAPDRLFAIVRHGWENPGQAARASLQSVEYRLEGDRITRATRTALDGVPADEARVVLAGVHDVRLDYLHEGIWQDGWPGGRERLPEALRLTMEVDGIGRLQQDFAMSGLGE